MNGVLKLVSMKLKFLKQSSGIDSEYEFKIFLEKWFMEESAEMIASYFQMNNRLRDSGFRDELFDSLSLALLIMSNMDIESYKQFFQYTQFKYNDKENNTDYLFVNEDTGFNEFM